LNGANVNKELLTGLLACFLIVGPAHAIPIEWAEWQEPNRPNHGNDFIDIEIPEYSGITMQEIASYRAIDFRSVGSFVPRTYTDERQEVMLNDATVAVTTPIPEPATMILFGAGLVGFAGLRIRKKKLKLPWPLLQNKRVESPMPSSSLLGTNLY